jgi:hypothetical protein
MPPASFSAGMMTERKIALLRDVVQDPIVIEESDVRLLRAHRFALLALVGELVGVARERLLYRRKALVALLEVLAWSRRPRKWKTRARPVREVS